MTSGSISFDRAADYYDNTRSIAPETWAEVVARLCRELSGRGRVLEAGVGTGRAALPLASSGIPVIGLDISEAMMAKLRSKDGRRTVPLVDADATRMPFPDASFGAAYLIHLLHLIGGWRDALAEIVRVVRRPGVVLVDPGYASQRGMSFRLTRRFAREAGATLDALLPGLTKVEELDAAMAGLGAQGRLLPEITISRARSIRAAIEDMASGSQAFTWSLDEQTRRAAGERTLAWAEKTFGSLDDVRRMRWRIAWRAYDLGQG